MKILVNVLALNKEQREAVAGFILTFPTGETQQTSPLTPPDIAFAAGAIPLPALPGVIPPAPAPVEVSTAGLTPPDIAFAAGAIPLPALPGVIPPAPAPVEVSTAGLTPPDIAFAAGAIPLPALPGVIPPAPAPVEVSTAGPHLVIPAAPNVDKNRLPWDERIHASTKVLTEKGEWRRKRGIDDALITQVETELRQLMSIPAPAPVVVTHGYVAVVPAPVVAPEAQFPPPPPPITESQVPSQAAIPALPTVDDRKAFVELVNKCSVAIQNGKLTQAEMNAVCLAVGVPSLALAGNRLDLIPSLDEAISQLIAGR